MEPASSDLLNIFQGTQRGPRCPWGVLCVLGCKIQENTEGFSGISTNRSNTQIDSCCFHIIINPWKLVQKNSRHLIIEKKNHHFSVFQSELLNWIWPQKEILFKDSFHDILRPPHTAQTQTNSQLFLSDHSVASCLTRSAEKLHWTHHFDVLLTPQ